MTKRCKAGQIMYIEAKKNQGNNDLWQRYWRLYCEHALHCPDCGGQKPGAITQPLDMAGLKEQEQKE